MEKVIYWWELGFLHFVFCFLLRVSWDVKGERGRLKQVVFILNMRSNLTANNLTFLYFDSHLSNPEMCTLEPKKVQVKGHFSLLGEVCTSHNFLFQGILIYSNSHSHKYTHVLSLEDFGFFSRERKSDLESLCRRRVSDLSLLASG